MIWRKTRYPGIVTRHRMIGTRGDMKPCPGDTGGRCRCTPSYRVRYRDESGAPKWSPVKHDLNEARSWQTDNRNGAEPVEARTGDTFEQLAKRFIAGARAGTISARGGETYSPRTLDIYAANLKRHVYPSYGDRPAKVLMAMDWQLLVDGLSRHGLSHNTIQVVMNGVRAVYRWACAPSRRLLPLNETRGVEMPAKDEKRRDRIATPAEARLLLGALSQPCDVLDFGLALYAGLRNKERWGMTWEDVVWSGSSPRVLSVRREITKSNAGVRTLPVIGWLRPLLMREWMRQGKPTSGLVIVYPNGGRGPNAYKKQSARAEKAWVASKMKRITPHECRHTFASYLIASGLNAKAVTVLMGHASVTETFDRYGHLFPGHEDEAGGLLDSYLGVPEPDRETGAVSV